MQQQQLLSTAPSTAQPSEYAWPTQQLPVGLSAPSALIANAWPGMQSTATTPGGSWQRSMTPADIQTEIFKFFCGQMPR